MLKEKQTSNFNLNLFLLVPLFFIIHNFEEALTMAEWSQKIPEFIHPVVTGVQFIVAVTILSVIGIIVTVLAKYMFDGKYFVNICVDFLQSYLRTLSFRILSLLSISKCMHPVF